LMFICCKVGENWDQFTCTGV